MDILFWSMLLLWTLLLCWRFSLVVLCMPLLFLSYMWSTTIAGVPVNFLEMSTVLLGVVWAGRALWERSHPQGWWQRCSQWWEARCARDTHPWWQSYAIGIGLLVLGVLLSFVVIPREMFFHRGLPFGEEYEVFATLRMALGIVKGWIVIPLIYVWVLSRTLRRREDVHRMWMMYVLSAVILSVLSGWMGTTEGLDRLVGPFASPNYLAMYVAPAWLYGVITWCRHGQRGQWVWWAAYTVGIALMGWVLLETKTYGSWIGLWVALLYSVYFLLAPKWRWWAYGGLVAVVVVGAALLAPTEKFQRFWDGQGDSSTAVRMEVYAISLGMIGEYPWTGIGPGQYEARYKVDGPRYLDALPKEWVMLHPHNTVAAFWLFSGLLGLVGYGWLLVAFVAKSLRNIPFHWPMVAVMVLLLVHGLVDTYFWKNDLIYITWMVLVSVTVLPKQKFVAVGVGTWWKWLLGRVR